MTTNKWRWQKIGCYVLLAIFATSLGYVGTRWVDASITHLYPLAFSPDGTRFISIQVVEGSNTIRRFRVRDTDDGAVVADLSEFQWINGYRFRWSDDGTHIGGVARTADRTGYRIISVQVRPVVQLSAEVPFDREGRLRGIDFSSNNQLVTQHSRPNGVLEFRTAGKVTSSLQVGKDEYVSVGQTIGDVVQVRVYAESKTDLAGKLVGDYLYTDGKKGTQLWIDRRDGRVLSKLDGAYGAIPGTIEYVATQRNANGGVLISSRSNPAEALIELPVGESPSFVVGQQVLTVNYPPRAIHVYDLESGERRLVAKSNELRSPNGPSQQPVFALGQRKLVRLSLANGEIFPLVDLTVSSWWKWSMVVGLPLLWMLWIAVGVQFGSRYPFLDMILLSFLTMIAFMFWSMSFLREYRPDLGTTTIGMVSISTAAMLVLIWGSSAKTFWGTLLPSSVTSIALVVLLIRIWSYNSSFRIVEGLVGATIGLGSQILGLWLLRKLAGRIVRPHAPSAARLEVAEEAGTSADKTGSPSQRVEGEAQMTLRQGLAMMVAFCVLFAVVSQARLGDFSHPGVGTFVLWLMLFTSQLSVAGVTATYAALRWKNVVVSFFSAVGVSSFYSILVYAITRNWQLNLLISPFGRWILPVFCGFLVWVSLRYCGFHGYRLELARR